MKIYSVTDSEFARFGRVIDIDTAEIVKVGENFYMPKDGSKYVAAVLEFEILDIMRKIKNDCFGGLDTQLGYCYGHNSSLNALEWHKCSEINIGVTELILLLGDLRDLEDGNRFSSENVRAFRLKKGQAIEVYATTLHFCPIETEKSGFGCVVGLLKGTNTDLEEKSDDRLLFRKNKWLIAHEDNAALLEKGVFGGIYGENYTL